MLHQKQIFPIVSDIIFNKSLHRYYDLTNLQSHVFDEC